MAGRASSGSQSSVAEQTNDRQEYLTIAWLAGLLGYCVNLSGIDSNHQIQTVNMTMSA